MTGVQTCALPISHRTPPSSAMSRYISGFAHNGQFLEGGEKNWTSNYIPYITQFGSTNYACWITSLKPLLHPQNLLFRSKKQHNGHFRCEGGKTGKILHYPLTRLNWYYNNVLLNPALKRLLHPQNRHFLYITVPLGGPSPWGVKIGKKILAPCNPHMMDMKLMLHTEPAKTNVEKVISGQI